MLDYMAEEGIDVRTHEIEFRQYEPFLIGARAMHIRSDFPFTNSLLTGKLMTIRLEKGRGKLSLTAPEIPGQQVMDFRLMMLKRL